MEVTKRMKVAGGILFVTLGGALALALLLTLYVDQSIRRPADVERKLRAPLFAAIPDFFNNGEGKELKFLAERSEPAGPTAARAPRRIPGSPVTVPAFIGRPFATV